MAQLAKDLQAKGIKLVNPFEKHKEEIAAAERIEPPKKRRKSTTVQFDHDVVSPVIEEEEEEEEEEKIMPSKKIMSSIRRTKHEDPDSPGLSNALANLSMAEQRADVVTGTMTCPMIVARVEDFDWNTDVDDNYVLMRIHIISGLSDDDFVLSFIDEYTFKIKYKWPRLFQKCLMMTGMDVSKDVNGNIVERFPRGHPIYAAMGKAAKKMKDETGFIWTESFFTFERPMQTNNYQASIFELPAPMEGHILQVYFHEKVELPAKPTAFTSPIAMRVSGKAGTPPGKSDSDQGESYMDEWDSDEWNSGEDDDKEDNNLSEGSKIDDDTNKRKRPTVPNPSLPASSNPLALIVAPTLQSLAPNNKRGRKEDDASL